MNTHTPEEAKNLWCPMARVAAYTSDDHPLTQTVSNRRMHGMEMVTPASANCIADRCAMWRWEPTTASVPTTTLGAGGDSVRVFETRTVRTHGYCGLAPLAGATA